MCAGSARQSCAWLSSTSVDLYALTAGYVTDHKRERVSHGGFRKSIRCDRTSVRTLDYWQIPKCGSIAVGCPGRLYNAHNHVMQLAASTVPHNAPDVFTWWNWRQNQFLAAIPHGVRHGCPITLQPNMTEHYRGTHMRTRRCPPRAQESWPTVCI